MLPFLYVGSYVFPISTLLLIAYIIISFIWSVAKLRELSVWKVLWLTSLIAGGGLVGARLFHLLIERPLTGAPASSAILSLSGLSINGSFIGVGVFLLFGLKLVVKENRIRQNILDQCALVFAFGYGLLKLGCFSMGCCWGHIAHGPLSVTFWSSPVMPLIGVPVHPVQLYDSFLGFSILFVLLGLKRFGGSRFRGQFIAMFMLLYGIGRFVTEYFRADLGRVDHLIFNFSMGQVVALAMAVLSFLWLIRVWKMKLAVIRLLSLLSVLLLTGCLLPEPPQPHIFEQVEPVVSRSYEVWRSHDFRGSGARHALFVFADQKTSQFINGRLQSTFSDPQNSLPKIEDLVWWEIAPALAHRYARVWRLGTSDARYETIQGVMRELERHGVPFDVFFFSHGMPGHLSRGQNYFLSTAELANWKNSFKHLELVYMHACYSSSLAKDWLQTGAKYVISQDGLSLNHFFPVEFIKELTKKDIAASYASTARNLERAISRNQLYSSLIELLDLTVADYMSSVDLPRIESLGSNSP